MLSQWERLRLVFQASNLSARIFWDIFPFYILTWITSFYGFSRVTPFGVCGGPEKDRDVCLLWDITCALPGFVLPAVCPSA